MACTATTFPRLFLFLALTLCSPPRAAETASPFLLGPQDAIWAASTAGLQIWGQIRYFDMEPARPSELDRDDLPPLDRWAAGNYSVAAARVSDVLLFPAVAGPLALSAWDAATGGSVQGALAEAAIYSEALVLSSSLNLLVRSTRVHARPYVYGSDAPDSEKRKGEASGSFYSGHANASFLAAAWLSYVYPLRHPGFEHAGWLRAGVFGYAAVVAGLRVAAGKHFPSDVLVGAMAGAAFGWLFPWMHRRPGGPAAGDGGPAGKAGTGAGNRSPLEARIHPLWDGLETRLTYRF